jgi:hypothetical protein
MYFFALVQCFDNPLPSADSPWIQVRRFHRYYQVAVTSHTPFRVLGFPWRRYLTSCDFRFEKVARLHRIALVTRSVPGFREERRDLSSVRETSIVRSRLLLRPRSDHRSRPYRRGMLFLRVSRRETPTIRNFGGSITGHSDWLFTLRSTVSSDGRSRIR